MGGFIMGRTESLVQHESFFTRMRRLLKGGYTFKEVKDRWSAIHYPILSKSAVTSYELSFSYAKEFWNWPITKLKYKHYQAVINDMHNKGLTYSSQKKFKNLVGQCLDFAIKNEWAEFNYAPMLQLDRHIPVHNKVPFSEMEIRRLWHYYNRYSGVDIVLMLIYTGVRVGEFLRIDMKKDCFLDDRYFIVRESKTEAGRNRMVPIHRDILPFFKARRKYQYAATDRKGHYFSNYNSFHKMFREVMEKMNTNHTIHETRHTCATLLDSAGANDMATKKILGHAGTGITKQVYIHKYLTDLLQAIDLVKGRDI
jgi:integrase